MFIFVDSQMSTQELEEYQFSRGGVCVGPGPQTTASMDRWRRLNNNTGCGRLPPPPPPKPPSAHRSSLPNTTLVDQFDGRIKRNLIDSPLNPPFLFEDVAPELPPRSSHLARSQFSSPITITTANPEENPPPLPPKRPLPPDVT